ncbi:MAG: TetR/AcrR family transcriptional regulator [Spirochaetes bacterium]|nr:TetR/AcrR family transcriptional regulator [Spirochaetota bacterium]
MAQTLKETIKESIDGAALRLFSMKGLQGTTIASIAQEAGISVGNVYTYYSNKEELFYTLMPKHFIDTFLSLLRSKYKTTDGRSLSGIMQYGPMILRDREMQRLLMDHRERIIILLDKADGTRYEPFRENLIGFMIRNVREYVDTMKENEMKPLDEGKYRLLRIIYDNLLQAFVEILRECRTEGEIEESYERLLSYHYGGIMAFLN